VIRVIDLNYPVCIDVVNVQTLTDIYSTERHIQLCTVVLCYDRTILFVTNTMVRSLHIF
jgi:hypothetical protein